MQSTECGFERKVRNIFSHYLTEILNSKVTCAINQHEGKMTLIGGGGMGIENNVEDDKNLLKT